MTRESFRLVHAMPAAKSFRYPLSQDPFVAMKPKGLHCRVEHSTREFSKRTKASVMMLLDDAALRTVSDDGPASFVRSSFGMSVGAHSNAIHPSYLPRYSGTKYSGA